MRPCARDLRLGEELLCPLAAEPRMNAGDELDGLLDPEPSGQNRDIGDERGLGHQLGARGERLAAEHLELAFIGGESEYGAQGRGLAGAVRTDEPDDAAGLHGKIDVVESDLRTESLGEAARLN